jgi:hypothetical protein
MSSPNFDQHPMTLSRDRTSPISKAKSSPFAVGVTLHAEPKPN